MKKSYNFIFGIFVGVLLAVLFLFLGNNINFNKIQENTADVYIVEKENNNLYNNNEIYVPSEFPNGTTIPFDQNEDDKVTCEDFIGGKPGLDNLLDLAYNRYGLKYLDGDGNGVPCDEFQMTNMLLYQNK